MIFTWSGNSKTTIVKTIICFIIVIIYLIFMVLEVTGWFRNYLGQYAFLLGCCFIVLAWFGFIKTIDFFGNAKLKLLEDFVLTEDFANNFIAQFFMIIVCNTVLKSGHLILSKKEIVFVSLFFTFWWGFTRFIARLENRLENRLRKIEDDLNKLKEENKAVQDDSDDDW